MTDQKSRDLWPRLDAIENRLESLAKNQTEIMEVISKLVDKVEDITKKWNEGLK